MPSKRDQSSWAFNVKYCAAAEYLTEYAKIMKIDVEITKKEAVGDRQRVGVDYERDQNKKLKRPSDIRCTVNAAKERKEGNKNEQHVDQQGHT